MKSFLILVAFTFTLSVYSQDLDWQLYTTVNGVEIYTAESDCHATNIPAQKAIIVKVVNTTGQNIIVEWDKAIWYNDELVTNYIANGENHYRVEVAKNSKQEGSCDVPFGPFYIYKDFIDLRSNTKLTKFELQNIIVTLL